MVICEWVYNKLYNINHQTEYTSIIEHVIISQ